MAAQDTWIYKLAFGPWTFADVDQWMGHGCAGREVAREMESKAERLGIAEPELLVLRIEGNDSRPFRF